MKKETLLNVFCKSFCTDAVSLFFFFFFFNVCENESRNTQTGYILFLFIYLFGGTVLFQKLISSIAAQPMQWIQMIHNSHVFNMQIVKNSHLLFPINGMQRTKSICILSCRTNDKHNMLTILQGGMANKLHTIHFSQMYEQIKSHNKVEENVFLLHSYWALCHRRGSSWFSMHQNRTNRDLQYNKGGHFMVHLIHHVTVSLCTMKTIIYKAHNIMSLFFRGNHFDCSLRLILQQSGEYS